MGFLFGGQKQDNSQQIAMQQKQLALQEEQNKRLDAQERDQKAATLARMRAGQSGGSRALMSESSLVPENPDGQSTLGANAA